jgi:uncharacterized coiled-coil protein SlyX
LATRISLLESAVFLQESEDQFKLIRDRIIDIEAERAKRESDILLKISHQKEDFDTLNFYFQNYKEDLVGMKTKINTLHKQFKDLAGQVHSSKSEISDEVKLCIRNN